MHNYVSRTLLTVALMGTAASNADQITIINKLNFPSRCSILWDQDPVEIERQAPTQQSVSRVYERVSLMTTLANDPKPQVITIPSLPGYTVTGFRITCDAIGNTSINNGRPQQADLIPGKTYTLERGQETAGTKTTYITRDGNIVQETIPTTNIELIIKT